MTDDPIIEAYEERAAILEYDAGMDQRAAELTAWAEIVKKFAQADIEK